jgi:hypothetical protein
LDYRAERKRYSDVCVRLFHLCVPVSYRGDPYWMDAAEIPVAR